MIHLNSYRHQHLHGVAETLQFFFASPSGPFAPADAVIGVHKAVLHSLTVFDVDDGIRRYVDEMVNKGYGPGNLEDHIKRRIAQIDGERDRKGYPADWPLRGLLVILRDAPLTPYKPERSLPRRIFDRYVGVPTEWQLMEHEESLLEPVAVNMIGIVEAYFRAKRGETV